MVTSEITRIRARYRDYVELCKPRVVMLMLLTALVGMQLGSQDFIPWQPLVFGMLGIGLSASAAAVINHLIDRHIDAKMARTQQRPIAQGRVTVKQALVFASILAIAAGIILVFYVNALTAWLTFFTFLGYAFIYSYYLKRATPQNIVIGGLSGAMPPLLGWTAVTNQLDPFAWVLVLIIFVWTPPHFWALAIYRQAEYAKAGIPMLPVTHGERFTKLNILLYTVLLFAGSLLPAMIAATGVIYLIAAVVLGLGFLYWAVKLYFTSRPSVAMQTFKYSILYLMLLFLALLFDHFYPILWP